MCSSPARAANANDTAIRLVRRYWQLEGQPERNIIISRCNAYHGSTIAGASLGGMKCDARAGRAAIPGLRAHRPALLVRARRRIDAPTNSDCAAARELEAKILQLGADRVAAFIGEPVQGAGGVIIPPESYWPEIQRICDEYGILLVSDEVICGFGRTGQWFGCEYYGTRPDLMTIAKGFVLRLPADRWRHGWRPGGQAAHRKWRRIRTWVHLFGASRVQRGCVGEPGHHRSAKSWSSACATTAGPYLHAAGPSSGRIRWSARYVAWACWGPWSWSRPGSPRTLFEPAGKVGERCRDNAIANGLVMRATRDTMIVAPPLVITNSEIDELVEKARRTLDMTLAGLKQDGWL